MSDNGFAFTDEMAVVSNQLWKYTSIVGAAMCFFILLVITGTWLHPESRPHLDRVSFRLVTYALVTNTVFGIVNAIGGSFTGPTWACGFTIFILQFTLEFSSFLTMSIALNLQLVIVHRINGCVMEKYYVAGSLLISACLTIPAYATQQYGWDPLVKDCWYANSNLKERLAWQIGTQLFWTMLTVVLEVSTALIVIGHMIRHRSMLKRAIPGPSSICQSCAGTQSSKEQHLNYANKYRYIIIRIALYPFASCIINITSVACVIRATVTNGVHSMFGYRVLLLSDFVYGGRAIVYALLAATDPSLVRAIRSLFRHLRGTSSLLTREKSDIQFFHPNFSRLPEAGTVHIELSTFEQVDKRNTLHAVPFDKAPAHADMSYSTWTDYSPTNKVSPDLTAEDSGERPRSAGTVEIQMRRAAQREEEALRQQDDAFQRLI